MRYVLVAAGCLCALSAGLAAQSTQEAIERAVLAAPANAREGATVVKWKPDHTYETLREGTNTWVCYDQSGLPTERPFSVQCTSLANLPRVAQNRRFETIADRDERRTALDQAEAAGTRVKPEYGSVWRTMSGPDQAQARTHVTIAVPGATTETTGLPETPEQGGVWIMNAGTSTAHIMTPGS